tara:strand:+ start:28 stop:1101 length:1074 start_codon:yes stop_codon:yes gene_type:complete
MKKSVYIIFLIGFNVCGQIKIIDNTTLKPISMVYVISSQGSIFGVSDINGLIAINKSLINNTEKIELSHTSYQKKIINTKNFSKLLIIKLKENITILNEVTISSKINKPDYLVLKGYYRSYQLDNNIPKAFSDGIVEYYISINNNRKLKFNLLENRSFKNNLLFDRIYKKKEINTENTTGPPYIEKKILLKELKNDIVYQNNDSVILNANNTIIGYKTLNPKNKTIKIHIDLNTPERSKTKKLLNRTFKFTNVFITETYKSNLDNKSNLLSREKYVKRIIHQKNKDSVIVESLRQFYVLEKKYASKIELKHTPTSSYFGPHKTKYSTKYWENLKQYNIPELPESISKLLGTKLNLDK